MTKVYELSTGPNSGKLFSNLKKAYLGYAKVCRNHDIKPRSYSAVALGIKQWGTFSHPKRFYYVSQRPVF